MTVDDFAAALTKVNSVRPLLIAHRIVTSVAPPWLVLLMFVTSPLRNCAEDEPQPAPSPTVYDAHSAPSQKARRHVTVRPGCPLTPVGSVPKPSHRLAVIVHTVVGRRKRNALFGVAAVERYTRVGRHTRIVAISCPALVRPADRNSVTLRSGTALRMTWPGCPRSRPWQRAVYCCPHQQCTTPAHSAPSQKARRYR